MNVSYEYIMAGFIVILVLTSTQIYTTQLLARKAADWEQLAGYDMADSLIDTLVLSRGEPLDWQDSPSNPVRIGLASSDVFDEYSLDASKVWRLTPNASGYISPSTLRSLMGITSTTGLSLRIMPVLNTTITCTSPGNYLVKVFDLKGLMVPNVNVTAYYLSLPFDPYVEPEILRLVTDTSGEVSLSYTPKENPGLIVCVGQSDILSLSAYPEDVLLTLTVQGNHVVSSPRPAAIHVDSTTGSIFGYEKQVSSRYVKIEGYAYNVELMLWS